MRLTADDGHEFDAYEVAPESASASIVVVQEIFGVNPHIRMVTDRFAALGYRAIAPAIFDRVEPGIELEYTAEGVAQGRTMAMEVRWEPAMRDIAAAVAHVSGTGPVAVIGYCFGGSLAWLSANELPIAAAIGYYGGQVIEFIDRAPRVPTMLHFGALDHAIPLDGVASVAAAHPSVAVHIYDGAEHGFNCDARGSFNPIASTIALGRTVEFLLDAGVRP